MTREEELLHHAPDPGTRILLRFPKPHAPQKQDDHWYPGIVIRKYVRERIMLSAVVFVDYYADPPKPPGGTHVAPTTGPVLTCMDIEQWDPAWPDKGGYKLV